MTMPGMLDINSNPLKPRRSMRSRFITKIFAWGTAGLLIGSGIAIAQNAPEADATSQAAINQYIRANGGIPPCKHEDGSGQPGMCLFDSRVRGNKTGNVIVLVPEKGADDKRVVVLIQRVKR